MDTPLHVSRVISASVAAVILCTAAALNAQDNQWYQQITRARDAIASGRYDEGAELATDALRLIGRSDEKDSRRPQTMNLLAAAKHLQGRFVEAVVLFKDAIAIWRAGSEPAERTSLAVALRN